MIGLVTVDGKTLLKLFTRTRYDTAGLVDALVMYFNKVRAGFAWTEAVSIPRLMVLEEWMGSKDSAPTPKRHVNNRLTVIRLLKPERADKKKCVVDRVVDLDEHRSSADAIGHFVWMVGAELGNFQKLPDDVLRSHGLSVKILPKKQEPDMTEVADFLAKEFERFALNQSERLNQNVDTMARKMKSRVTWTKTFGFDTEKEIRARAPAHVQVWLDVMSDVRRQKPDKNYQIVEVKTTPLPKKIFEGKVA